MDKNRELDTWIAEHVMGWKRIRYVDSGNVWLASPGVVKLTENEGSAFVCDGDQKGQADHVPHYSLDISAAFEVVEKMREKGWTEFTLNRFDDHGGKWQAIFTRYTVPIYGPDDTTSPDCDTPALAICLAAQQALTPNKEK
jgi:hypothetical protein